VVEKSLVPFHYGREVALSITKLAFLFKITWFKKKTLLKEWVQYKPRFTKFFNTFMLFCGICTKLEEVLKLNFWGH